MNNVDCLLARAQVGLAFLFGLAFVAVLILLLMSVTGAHELSAQANALLTGLLGVFGTIVTLQQNYFFARHRPAAGALPDGGGDIPTQPVIPALPTEKSK